MSYRADKQVIDTHTHTDTRTDTQTQEMTIPEGQNWPRVKTESVAIRGIFVLVWCGLIPVMLKSALFETRFAKFHH